MLLNVEYAYWNLYGAYYTLYSREQGLRYALVSWQVNKTRFEAGRITIQDLEQTRAQYELFRAQRFTALGRVLDAERQLRGLIGLPVEDGKRLVPSDAPMLAAFTPDWPSAVNEALALRPELVLARQDLKFRQLDLIAQKNALKPDLRFFATYDVNGLGTRLDGGANRVGRQHVDANGNPVSLTDPGNALQEPGLQQVQQLGTRPADGRADRLPRRSCRGPGRPAQPQAELLPAQGHGEEGRFVPGPAIPQRHPVLPAKCRPSTPSGWPTPPS